MVPVARASPAFSDFRIETFELMMEPIVIGDGCRFAACAFVGPGAVVPPGTMVRARGGLTIDDF